MSTVAAALGVALIVALALTGLILWAADHYSDKETQ